LKISDRPFTLSYARVHRSSSVCICLDHQMACESETRSDHDSEPDANDGYGTFVETIKERTNKTCVIKSITAAILVGFIIFVIVDSAKNEVLAGAIQAFLAWVEQNPAAGIFAFAGVYFLATVLFVPGSILTLGAGFVFSKAFGLGPGVLLATLCVFVGATSGDIASFLLGRYLLRERVTSWTVKYPLFKAIDKALENQGFRIMVLLRLSPIIPFNALNYCAGTTAITFSAYVWAGPFILPGTALFCFVGASAGSLSDMPDEMEDSTVRIVSTVVGVLFGIAAVAVTGWYAKKELNKIIAEQGGEEDLAASLVYGEDGLEPATELRCIS